MFEPIIRLCRWVLNLTVCQRRVLAVLVHLGILLVRPHPAFGSCLQTAGLFIQVKLNNTNNIQGITKFDCNSPEQEMPKLTHNTDHNRCNIFVTTHYRDPGDPPIALRRRYFAIMSSQNDGF